MSSRPLRPMAFLFPTLVEEPPEGDDWIHEVKYDGYRTQVIIQDRAVTCHTRGGHDWTHKYPYIAEQARSLDCREAILDGEIIVPDEAGASDFHAVQRATAVRSASLAFVAFDLLWLNGFDLRGLSCVERRERLWELVRPAEGHIQYSQHLQGNGKAFFQAAERMELEGIVSKRASSVYMAGRQRTWLKTKCYEVSDYEIAGILRQPGLMTMALMVNADRRYVGSAAVTLARRQRERLWQRVRENAGGAAPEGFRPKPGIEWVKPGLKAQVKHLKGEAMLRHASLKDLRED